MVSDPTFDPPAPHDIVSGIRALLVDSVLPALHDPVAFQVRIAINSLGIVERELRLGPTLARAHGERLERLGFDSERSLALAVKDGRADPRDPAVADAALAWVRSKLEVTNPEFLAQPSFEADRSAGV